MGLSRELFHVDFKGRAKVGHALLQARKTAEDVLTAHALSRALGAQGVTSSGGTVVCLLLGQKVGV